MAEIQSSTTTPQSETQKNEPIKVSSIFDLQPGKNYRLHRISYDAKEKRDVNDTSEDFYVTKPPERDLRLVRDLRIDVRQQNPARQFSKNASDLHVSYHLSELGDAISADVGIHYTVPLERYTPKNWVEEIPETSSTSNPQFSKDASLQ